MASKALTASGSSELSTLFTLPSDIIIEIVDRLGLAALAGLAFAYYPKLRQLGVVPSMSKRYIASLVDQSKAPKHKGLPVPTEILYLISENLNPLDKMRFVIANYCQLEACCRAPPMTEQILDTLKAACED